MPGKHPSIAKITRPVPKGILERERLYSLLDDLRMYSVTWVGGPPGSGKTTLVSSYLQSRKLPCLWYQVDEGDSDIATFFYYMSMAAKKAAPRKRRTLPLFTPEYALGIPVFTRRYFENLYSCFKAPFVLVVDNYQDAPISSEFHEMVSHGFDVIPEGLNVLVISRKKPPPIFARLHLSNKIQFLGWDEIRFSVEEIKELVRMKTQRMLTDEILLQIYKKTEGWIAGLVLILESLKFGIDDIDYQSLDRFPQEGIFDYFKIEIFERRDKGSQEFLLKTAFFPKMTSQLAEKLTGISTSRQILADLSESHYFMEMFPGNETVYQYHTLFREFLLSRARASFTQDMISLIQQNAAGLLEEHGQIEDAARLLLESNNFEGLTRLIHNWAEHLVAQGRSQTLLEWLNFLPYKTIENNPWLLYWMGVCSLPFYPEESHVQFEKAFQSFKMQKDAPGTFLALSGIVESIVYGYRGLKPLDRWFPVIDELLKEFKGFPSKSIEAQITCSMVRALGLRQPSNINMDEWVNRLIAVTDTSTNIPMKIRALLNLACYQYGVGDLQKLEMSLNSLEELMQHADVFPLARLIVYWMKAALFNVTSEYGHCQKVISDGLELVRSTGIHVMDHMLLGYGALSSLKAGSFTNAKRYLQEMSTTLSLVRPWQASFYHYTATWIAIYSGNLTQALTNSEQCLALCEDLGDPWSSSLAYLQRAYISHALGENERLGDYIDKARSIGIKSKNEFTHFISLLTEAYFLLKQGKEAPAFIAIREGLKIGRKKGYVNLYMWPPGVMEIIFSKALEENIEVPYVQNLIRRNALLPEDLCADIEEWPWPVKVYTFGRFGLLKDGKPLQISKKKQQKPHSMLKALIALGGRDVKEEQLTDLLWPDAEGDAAHSAFTTTLSRLRQLLDIEEAIKYKEGRITLDPRHCWVDAWVFERLVSKAEAGLKMISETETLKKGENEKSVQAKEIITLTEKAINLYKGHFLLADEGYFWTASCRERLRNKFLRLVSRSGNYLQKSGQWEKAVEYYQKAIEIDDLTEDFYQNLMLCYQQLDQKAEAIKVYKRCCKVFSAVLGIEPSSKTETIYKSFYKPSSSDD